MTRLGNEVFAGPDKNGREHRETQRKDGHVKTEAEMSDVATSPEAPGATRGWGRPRGKARTESPSEPSEEAWPADTSILDFWPPEVQDNKFPLF